MHQLTSIPGSVFSWVSRRFFLWKSHFVFWEVAKRTAVLATRILIHTPIARMRKLRKLQVLPHLCHRKVFATEALMHPKPTIRLSSLSIISRRTVLQNCPHILIYLVTSYTICELLAFFCITLRLIDRIYDFLCSMQHGRPCVRI